MRSMHKPRSQGLSFSLSPSLQGTDSSVPELFFLLAPIGAEPGRAKRESRITSMRIPRTPPFFPKIGEKPYLEVLFPDLARGVIF